MGTITTLRPSATSSGVGWTATPSGTLNGVTSDDSDSTYALWAGSGSALILATPADAPPAGERRHQARLRMRGEDGDAWGAVRLASGALVAGAAAQFASSPGTITGAWGTGIPADGSTVMSAYVTGQTSGVKIEELYLDVDSRLAPDFTLSVLDGSGSVSTTISDTTQPTISAGTPDLDDLTARQYRFWITLNGATVWDTGVTSGPASNRQTTPLDNGTYVAHAQVWSTLGQNTAYASDEETVTFTVSVGSIPAPEDPVVSLVPGTPFYEIQVCAPYAGDFDGDQAYVEIQRVDCPQGGYLSLPGTGQNFASTPDPGPYTAIQVAVSAQRDDGWRPASDQTLAAQYDNATPNRSWRLTLNSDGFPFLLWTTDGGTGGVPVTSTARPPIDAFGRATLRATLVPDDGAGGWSVTFETMDEDGAWVQLGDVLTNSGGGTTSLFDSTAPMSVGAWFTAGGIATDRWEGRIYWAEMRDGAAGAFIASPDFTGRSAGTTSFTDGQGNVWTVSSPATITSDQRITSVAILGPLDTDECATYQDFTLPRTGVGVTCEHTPDPCCSYYRARTVGRIDDQLQISDWSDAYDPGIPNGMIFLWPSTAASIPTGWDRVTALDAKYPKGIATSSTQPGTTGGAASHTHTVPTHLHDTSHSHTTSGNTSAAVGTFSSSDGAVGTTAILSTHTHTTPATNSATVSSGTAQPTIPSGNNDPARLEVVFIESNGQPLGVPNGALALTPDISLSGWSDHAAATGRFLRGATGGADGGTQVASAVDSHTHSIPAHTHTGTSHSHTSSNTGAVTSDKSMFAGPTSGVWSSTHAHPITIGSSTSAALNSGGSGTSGASSLGTTEPPFTNVRVQANGSGGDSLPVGLIGLWRGSIGSIPDHWALCDGTGGTPDLIGRYPKAATSSIGTTGGSLNPHTHTSPSHNHTTGTHSHTMTIGPQNGGVANLSTTATVVIANGTHTHTHGDTATATPTVGNSTSGTLASTTTEPPYEEVAFVQLVEEPTPPAAPEEFCLIWDDDEHLIRTTGPAGPLYAAVGGQITWDRDRPFTSATGVMGKRFVTSAAPGGRNLHLVTAVESEAELATLQAVLARPLVLVSPSDAAEVWAAPVASSVKVVKIGRVRQVTADFIATGPQPSPQLADVGA
jgi:hypothetical protein